MAFLVLYWGQGPFFIKKGGDDDCQNRLYTTKQLYGTGLDLEERLASDKIPGIPEVFYDSYIWVLIGVTEYMRVGRPGILVLRSFFPCVV